MDNNQFLTDWGLSLMVFLPLAGALLMMLIPKADEELHKVIALLASLASGAVGVAVLTDFNYDRAGDLQFVVDKTWIEVISSRFLMGIDGLSVPLVALTLLITPSRTCWFVQLAALAIGPFTAPAMMPVYRWSK